MLSSILMVAFIGSLGLLVGGESPADTKPTCSSPPECPRFAKLEQTGTDKDGCPIFGCSAVSRCPPVACHPKFIMKRLKANDKNGCPIFKCITRQIEPFPTGPLPTKPPRCSFPPRCPALAKLERTGTDNDGCPTFGCSAVSRCPPQACPPSTNKVVVGKNEDGCPHFGCIAVGCPLMACPPSTNKVVVGKNERGCKMFECIPRQIKPFPTSPLPIELPHCTPAPKCPPFAKLHQWGEGKDGCPRFGCTAVGCPLIACPPSTNKVVVGKNERGCKTFECVPKPTLVPCLMVPCPPETTVERLGVDERGCPRIKCVPCPRPKILCLAPSKLEAVWPKGEPRMGRCPTYACGKALEGKQDERDERNEDDEYVKQNDYKEGKKNWQNKKNVN